MDINEEVEILTQLTLVCTILHAMNDLEVHFHKIPRAPQRRHRRKVTTPLESNIQQQSPPSVPPSEQYKQALLQIKRIDMGFSPTNSLE